MSTLWPRFFGAGAVVSAVLTLAPVAGAETAKLAIERLAPVSTSRYSSSDFVYRMTSPQSFFMQQGVEGRNPSAAEFARIVKKEPKEYHSEHPFRGVVKLGSQQYAFVLDSSPPKAEQEPPKAEAGEKEDESDAKEADGFRLLGGESAKAGALRSCDLLYFDLNCNGDLTDDKPARALESGSRYSARYSYSRFPRIDLKVRADGEEYDYAFFFQATSHSSEAYSYVSASLSSAAYRKGEITLDGETRQVALLDFNSNGRFDDEPAIEENAGSSSGRIAMTGGDRLLIDPQSDRESLSSGFDVTQAEGRHHVSKLVNVDGRFYEMEASPGGDQLTLKPSKRPLGRVANPNDAFRAVMYGKDGCVTIEGKEAGPISLPEGQWKLLNYTMNRTGWKEPEQEAEKSEAEVEVKVEKSIVGALAKALVGGGTATTAPAKDSPPRPTLISARGSNDCPTVLIRPGKATELPFGAPYKPTVTAGSSRGGTVRLSLAIVGKGGEICTDLRVNGRRPDAPQFTITTAEGEEVAHGNFRYG